MWKQVETLSFGFFFSASALELKNAHKLVKYGRTLRNETSVNVGQCFPHENEVSTSNTLAY